MSIKGIFTVAIASTAILTGLASYSSAVFSTKIEQRISQQNSISGIEASIIERNNGFFTRDQTYKIVLSAEYLRQATNIPEFDKEVELYIPHHFVAYPLYISSDLNLDFSRGSLTQILQAIDLTDIGHQVSIGSNILLQSSTLTIDVAPLSHTDDNISVSHDGLKITANTDIDFSQGSVSIDFGGLNFGTGDKGQFSFSGLTSGSNFSTIDDIMVFTEMSGKLSKASFTDNVKKVEFSVDNISSTSSYSSLESDQVSLVADMTVGSLTFKDTAVDYLVTNTELEFVIDGLDKSGYLELEKVSRQLKPDPKVLTAALMKLVEAGGTGKVTKLNFNVNDVQFNSTADFTLPAYQGTLAQSELNQHVAQTFVLNADVNLSNNYAEKFAELGAMVEHFIQRGFIIKDDKGNVSTKITFAKGQLTANDNAVQM